VRFFVKVSKHLIGIACSDTLNIPAAGDRRGKKLKARGWLFLGIALACPFLARIEAQAPASAPGGVPARSSIWSRLAIDALADTQFIGRKRLTVDKSGLLVSYDPNPVPPNAVLSSGGSDARALEVLVRVYVLRRDLTSELPGETFWQQPLHSVEDSVNQCLNQQEGPGSPDNCLDRANGSFHDLEMGLKAYADSKNFRFVVTQPERDPVVGFHVHIGVGPPAARLQVMTLLEYKKSQYQKLPQDRYQWNDILDADNNMIGWYHYRVAWPAALGGMEEGDFDVVKPSAIAFKAPSK
jgi:hypothetical protein